MVKSSVSAEPSSEALSNEPSSEESGEAPVLPADLFDGGEPIAQDDGWFIYLDGSSHLGRVKPDGSENRLLTEDLIYGDKTPVLDGAIYYSNADDGNKLYSVKTDGSDKKIIEGRIMLILAYEDKVIYYIEASDDSEYAVYSLSRINYDGTGKQKLTESETEVYAIKDGWIYYSASSENGVFKMKTDGTEKQAVTTDIAGYTVESDDYLYYQNSDGKKFLYRIKTDGTGREKLNNISTGKIYVVNGTVYFNSFEESRSFYSLSTDGICRKIVEKQVEIVLECDEGFFYKLTENNEEKQYFYSFESKEPSYVGSITAK